MTGVRGQEPAWLSWSPLIGHVLEGARPGEVVLVDVGGGRGHDVSALKRKIGSGLPKAGRIVLEDLPAVLEDSGELEEGVEKVEYDFFTPQVVVGRFTITLLDIFLSPLSSSERWDG